MGARCDWHLASLVLPDDGDPLAEIEELKSAAMLDLTRSPEEIRAALARLVAREGRYGDAGLPLCDLKWEDRHVLQGGAGLSCFNCPHYVDDAKDERYAVCSLGRQQEGLLGELKAYQGTDSLDGELLAAHWAVIEESASVAEAVLA